MTDRRWNLTTKRVVVLLLLAVGAVLLLRTGELVVPFIWAAVLSYLLMPLVNWVEKRGVGRNLAALAVFLGLIATIFGVGRFAVPLAISEVRDLQSAFPRLLATAQQSVGALVDGTLFDQVDQILTRGVAVIIEAAPRMALPLAAAIGHFLLEFLIFLIGVFFFLRDAPKLKHWARRLIPASQRAELLPLIGQVSMLLGRYVRGQVLLMIIMGSVTTVALILFGLPYAFVLGIVTGILETIPIVGPITAGAIAVLVALGHQNPFGWPQLWYAASIAALYTVLRHAEDYFVIPLVIGRIVRLHPAIVIFSLLAGGTIGGLLGILLAVPTAATLRLVLVYVNAKLHDENPFPRLEEELAGAEGAAAEGTTHEPQPLGGSVRP